MRTINFKIKRGMKGTVVNQTCHFINGGSPELGLQSICGFIIVTPVDFSKCIVLAAGGRSTVHWNIV